MTNVHSFPKKPSEEPSKPLILCPYCDEEMSLLGIEAESGTRDLYTFECCDCDHLEARGVRVNKTPPIVIVAQT